MSRIIRIHKTGGPEVLQIEELNFPGPKAVEVRIAVKAFGINHASLKHNQTGGL